MATRLDLALVICASMILLWVYLIVNEFNSSGL